MAKKRTVTKPVQKKTPKKPTATKKAAFLNKIKGTKHAANYATMNKRTGK